LGTGFPTTSQLPIPIGLDTNWIAIDGGAYYSVALKSDGSLWAWGNNIYGQLGDGTTDDSHVPVVTGDSDNDGYADTDWKAVAVGHSYTMALKSDGTLWAWGWNICGQLGDGTTTERHSPVQVGTDTDWTAIAASNGIADAIHSVALKSNGTLWAWGCNGSGQVGDGTTTSTSSPLLITGRTKPLQVSAGYEHTVGLRSDGTVVATGDNYWHQCDVGSWTNIAEVSAGRRHTVGLRSDGTVVATGDNTFGQCNVNSWSNIVEVSAGWYHTVGLRSDGTVVATGDNGWNQCNVGSWMDIVQVSAGGRHTAGLRSDGTVVADGNNDDGETNVSSWTEIVKVSAGGYQNSRPEIRRHGCINVGG